MPDTVAEMMGSLEYRGERRGAALEWFGARLGEWGIALPPERPHVLDFGLDDFDRVGLIEAWICNHPGAGYCGKYMFVRGEQACPRHFHRVKHETFFVVRGRVQVMAGEAVQVLEQGRTLAIEPGVVHGFRGDGDALILELSMACDPADNYFEDPRVEAWVRRVAQGG